MQRASPNRAFVMASGPAAGPAWELSQADRLTFALFPLALLGTWQLPEGHLCPDSLSDSEVGLVPTGYGLRPCSELPNPS